MYMRQQTLLMTPGPTNIPNDIAAILSAPMPHHRSHAFAKTFQNLRMNLQSILQCEKGEVVVFASSGTGVMEAAITNFNNGGDDVLIVDTGYFGLRFVEIAKVYQLNVTHLVIEDGKAATVDEVERVLIQNNRIKTVYVTHHDTSTGIKNDIQAIGELLKKYPDVLFVIDSISGMIMHELKMKDWGIDVVLGASQKGFMVPPGLAFLSLSEKAIDRAKMTTLPRFYFDIPKQLEMLKMNQTFATPVISLIYAMEYATKAILKSGLKEQYERYQMRRQKLEDLLRKNQFELVVEDHLAKGNVVVPIYIPKELTPSLIVDYMERHSNIMIIGGYGKLKDTTVRIGVLGPITESDLHDTVRALTHAIEALQLQREETE